jgi:hypothetical protein
VLNPFGTFLNVIYIELMRDHKFFYDIAPSSRIALSNLIKHIMKTILLKKKEEIMTFMLKI